MNPQFYLEKLKNSEEFEKFKKENPSAFLCSAFFSIDKSGGNKSLTTSSKRGQSKGKDNKQHFDFFNEGKIFSFQVEDNCKKIELENFAGKIPSRISEKVNFEFRAIEKLIEKSMQKENIKNEIQKILFSLQNIDEVNSLIGTIFISGMGIINFKIDLNKNEIIDFEKKSIFDVLKVIKGK